MLPQVKKWSGKKSSRSGEVREFYYESEKTDILKKNQGKLKLFNTADLKLLTARRCIWGHCDLLKIYQFYERMEEEAATRPDLLHFLSFDQGKVREKSWNFEKGCLWQPYILHKEYPVWFFHSEHRSFFTVFKCYFCVNCFNAMECDGRWYDLKMVRSQCVLGSITSRCSGKEPALLP